MFGADQGRGFQRLRYFYLIKNVRAQKQKGAPRACTHKPARASRYGCHGAGRTWRL